MKKILFTLLVSLFVFNTGLSAETLGPVPEGGIMSGEAGVRETYTYSNMKLSDVENYYKELFKDDSSVSRQESESNVISFNDWGNKKWHNIKAVEKESGVEITVIKDSWTWIIGTLVIRFVGVFIILTILMIALYISGFFFKNLDKKKKTA